MRVGRVTPGVRVCDSLGVVERVDRLDIEPLVDRVIYGEDDREVLAAGLIPAKASEGVLDHDIGDVGLEVGGKGRNGREPGEFAGGVADFVNVGEGAEGLRAGRGKAGTGDD